MTDEIVFHVIISPFGFICLSILVQFPQCLARFWLGFQFVHKPWTFFVFFNVKQSFSRYHFSQRIHFVFVVILLRFFLARIGIAILAKMRVGVVFSNVLAHHATAELPLAFVAVVR